MDEPHQLRNVVVFQTLKVARRVSVGGTVRRRQRSEIREAFHSQASKAPGILESSSGSTGLIVIDQKLHYVFWPI